MKGNKIFKISFCLLLVSVCLLTFPRTFARFSYKEDGSLTYSTRLYKLYEEETMSLIKAEVESARLRFSFVPTSVKQSEETDKYEITIPSTCSFEKVESTGSVSGSGNNRTVTFDSTTSGFDPINVYMQCHVTAGEKVNVVSKVVGTLFDKNGSELLKFAHRKYSYIESYSDYQSHIGTEAGGTEEIPEGDELYTTFKKWVNDYAEQTAYKAVVTNYILSKYPNVDAIVADRNVVPYPLPGFSITYANDSYTFEVRDNFIGHARTYNTNVNVNPTQTTRRFIFSTDMMDAPFKYYLKTYAYPDNGAAALLVYDYVDSLGGVSAVLNGSVTIKGISKLTDDSINLDRNMILSDAIADKLSNGDISIVVADSSTMSASYSNQILRKFSLDVARQMNAIPNFRDTYLSTSSVDKYFVYQSGSNSQIIRVYTDSYVGVTYNRVNFTNVTIPTSVTTSFNDSGSTITVNISSNSEADIQTTIALYNTYFSDNHTEATLTPDASGNYVVTYTITK